MHKIVSGFINAFVCVYMRFVYFLLLSFKKMIEMMLFEKRVREREREGKRVQQYNTKTI